MVGVMGGVFVLSVGNARRSARRHPARTPAGMQPAPATAAKPISRRDFFPGGLPPAPRAVPPGVWRAHPGLPLADPQGGLRPLLSARLPFPVTGVITLTRP